MESDDGKFQERRFSRLYFRFSAAFKDSGNSAIAFYLRSLKSIPDETARLRPEIPCAVNP
jgi:hypothetical protein